MPEVVDSEDVQPPYDPPIDLPFIMNNMSEEQLRRVTLQTQDDYHQMMDSRSTTRDIRWMQVPCAAEV